MTRPDEQAREWLIRQDGRFHHESYMPGTVAELSALLAKVRLAEAEWWDTHQHELDYELHRERIDELKRQAVGEGTKNGV